MPKGVPCDKKSLRATKAQLAQFIKSVTAIARTYIPFRQFLTVIGIVVTAVVNAGHYGRFDPGRAILHDDFLSTQFFFEMKILQA